jgi:hypothetical protein
MVKSMFRIGRRITDAGEKNSDISAAGAVTGDDGLTNAAGVTSGGVDGGGPDASRASSALT